MFRCPNCAKVYRIPLSDSYSLLANHNMNSFSVVEDKLFEEGFKEKNMAKQMAALVYKAKSFSEAQSFAASQCGHFYDEETEIIMPCCEKPATTADALEAWERPEEYFEAEHLCGCGGELWMDRTIMGTYALMCEKCGWTKPRSAVSASDNATLA